MKEWFLRWLLWWVFKIISSTWRLDKRQLTETFERLVAGGAHVSIAHFHGDEWVLLKAFQNLPLVIMVSPSSDGNVMTFLLRQQGIEVVRGSSSRGAVAGFRAMLRHAQHGRHFSLAVDGPRGPVYQTKPGIAKLSQMAPSGKLIPVVCTSSGSIQLKTWDRTQIPLPFSRVQVHVGEIISATEAPLKDDSSDLHIKLHQSLIALKKKHFVNEPLPDFPAG